MKRLLLFILLSSSLFAQSFIGTKANIYQTSFYAKSLLSTEYNTANWQITALDSVIHFENLGLSQSEVNERIIYVSENNTFDNGFLYIAGSNASRTSASDSAIFTLADRGWTISVNGGSFGADLLVGWDFTVGWALNGGASIDNSTQFTNVSTGGVYKANFITVGKTYLGFIKGTTTNSVFAIYNGAVTSNYSSNLSSSFDTSFNFVASGDGEYYLRGVGAGTTTITSMSLREVIP